ncbi:MAG: class I SAM-dependent methyltransferase [Planctomycetes bacterium]|nr:class I SAM-dependent methyltransferase [Planctomycetota bacterium]
MPEQDHFWNQSARRYEEDFIDPYRPEVRSPLLRCLEKLAKSNRIVADLGCGIGPLLPFLADHFQQVFAIDFASGMLERAREKTAGRSNIEFLQRSLTDLADLHGRLDVAVAVNSLVLPDVSQLEMALAEIRACVKERGWFLGILPAMDAVHYYTILLVDRALAAGKPIEAARKNAAALGDLAGYDCAFGQYTFRGLEQHFWQPFEIRHRFGRTGWRLARLRKVHLAWKQFACWEELQERPPPWDWFFLARPHGDP